MRKVSSKRIKSLEFFDPGHQCPILWLDLNALSPTEHTILFNFHRNTPYEPVTP